MPTWNCANCNMPMTLVKHSQNVLCPNCGKKMIEVFDWILLKQCYNFRIISEEGDWCCYGV